jgi:signal transduction histidine kinase
MIVDFHKGEINIDSEEGNGTTITIKLPIEPDDGED